MDYKTAWLSAIDEYNNFGVAAHDAKHQIDKATANLMLGFKVRVWDQCVFYLIIRLIKKSFVGMLPNMCLFLPSINSILDGYGEHNMA